MTVKGQILLNLVACCLGQINMSKDNAILTILVSTSPVWNYICFFLSSLQNMSNLQYTSSYSFVLFGSMIEIWEFLAAISHVVWINENGQVRALRINSMFWNAIWKWPFNMNTHNKTKKFFSRGQCALTCMLFCWIVHAFKCCLNNFRWLRLKGSMVVD